MAEITPYIPDLDKIAENSRNPNPLILEDEEYEEVLVEHGLYRGSRLSDKGILRAMEAGLIKIWDEEGGLDILAAIQPASVDLRLGNEFWHYIDTDVSRLTLGSHRFAIEDRDMLAYNYRLNGGVFVFHPLGLVLTLTREKISLANVVVAHFDGKSMAARLGVSNHQTAGTVEPGFTGPVMMEVSNSNKLDVAVPAGISIASIGFTLLGEPSTRPRTQKVDSQSWADWQNAPFGFRKPEWDEEKARVIAGNIRVTTNHELTGDPVHLEK